MHMLDWLNSALITGILLLLLEARINIGTRVTVIERDLEWIRATLGKWGMIAPKE